MPSGDLVYDPALIGAVLDALKRERAPDRPWKDLAEEVGLHPTVISGVKGGHRSLTEEVAGKLAQAFGITVWDLAQRLAARKQIESDLLYSGSYGGDGYSPTIEGLITGYDDYDEYVTISSGGPGDFWSADARFVDFLVEGVATGKRFIYAFPKELTWDRVKNLNAGLVLYGNLLDTEKKFALWKGELKRNYPARAEQIETSVLPVPIDVWRSNLLFTLFAKYILRRRKPSDIKGEVVDGWIEVDESIPERALVQLDGKASRVLNGIYTNARDLNHERSESSSGAVPDSGVS